MSFYFNELWLDVIFTVCLIFTRFAEFLGQDPALHVLVFYSGGVDLTGHPRSVRWERSLAAYSQMVSREILFTNDLLQRERQHRLGFTIVYPVVCTRTDLLEPSACETERNAVVPNDRYF